MQNSFFNQVAFNWIDGDECPALESDQFPKFDPATGIKLCDVVRSHAPDVRRAVDAAKKAQGAWSDLTPVARGDFIRNAALELQKNKQELASLIKAETGKSLKDALGEVGAAIEMGFFIAGEGRRFYGRTTTSAVPHKSAMTVRQPIGVVGLIVAANTPIANVAWKAFPALLCGNTTVLKASEDTPLTALAFAKIFREAGIPSGVFNVIQGYGEEAGAPIVECPDVALISFTGSTAVGRYIQSVAGKRLAKVCLELGGKNPFVVCDDADLDAAVKAVVLSAFSNAGQRCASGSRVIVFENVYEKFKTKLLEATASLKVGTSDQDDFGPVINEEQLNQMLSAVQEMKAGGAKILAGGQRLTGPGYDKGFYMAPTWIEGMEAGHALSHKELFGPISVLYRVKNFDEALRLANESAYGLTAAIHTKNTDRAMAFLNKIKSGVASVNGATYGSEPHMPFGGLRDSGNGFREAGTEVLDVYSDWKTIYFHYFPGQT